MDTSRRPPPRLRIVVEAVVDVTDEPALQRAAFHAVDLSEFVEDAQRTDSGEDPHEEAKAAIRESAADAALWLADLATEAMPGVELDESSCEVAEIDQDGYPVNSTPDLLRLFELCNCGKPDCERCSTWQLTPRMAEALWSAAQILADDAYDDIEEYGDDPVREEAGWRIFNQYPAITHGQDAVWRRQAARAFEDLANDLTSGSWPVPRCFGEEMALHLMLEEAQAGINDGWILPSSELRELPAHPDDYTWSDAPEVLFQDADILTLFDPSWDGIADPHSDVNRSLGMGDMRPHVWFQPFENVTPRDGRRGFRR